MKTLQTFTVFALLLATACSPNRSKTNQIEKWGMYEVSYTYNHSGNPFTEVDLRAVFSNGEKQVQVTGFFDGDGMFKIRFMPDAIGAWTFVTQSNIRELNSQTGQFECIPPSEGNHGPVQVANQYFMEYADGTPYYQVGTTCYAWTHQGDSLEEITLNTLKISPFNKLRMCIFPKSYIHNFNEPEQYVFERDTIGKNDFSRFNPAYFHHLEKRLMQLQDAGIEADIILLHPYDRWGYASMPDTTDIFYLRYALARLSAFRNIWWSMANEFDFMKDKSMDDWHRIFQTVVTNDPYNHLRSIHNGFVFYDHALPWVSHASIQSTHFDSALVWSQRFKKPLVYDECRYEGNIEQGWGNLKPEEMVAMFWKGLVTASYVGHGETYNHPSDILWWAKGGVLHGQSPARIAFFKKYFEQIPLARFAPLGNYCAGIQNELYWYYFDETTPEKFTFNQPAGVKYRVELIDTWNMTADTLEGIFEGTFTLALPQVKYLAVRLTNVGYVFPVGRVDVVIDGQVYDLSWKKYLFWKDARIRLLHPFYNEIRYTTDGTVPSKTSPLYTSPLSVDKSQVLTVIAFDGNRPGEMVRAEIVASTPVPSFTVNNPQPGLNFSYYKGKWESIPDFNKIKAVKTGTTAKIDFSMIEDTDYFGIVYKGYIKIPEDGIYTFYTLSDDGSFLFINGRKIVENDFIHGTTEVKSQAALAAGYHTLEVQYFDNWYDHVLKVEISGKNMPRQEINPSLLFRD